jgi:hypothetical protein
MDVEEQNVVMDIVPEGGMFLMAMMDVEEVALTASLKHRQLATAATHNRRRPTGNHLKPGSLNVRDKLASTERDSLTRNGDDTLCRGPHALLPCVAATMIRFYEVCII